MTIIDTVNSRHTIRGMVGGALVLGVVTLTGCSSSDTSADLGSATPVAASPSATVEAVVTESPVATPDPVVTEAPVVDPVVQQAAVDFALAKLAEFDDAGAFLSRNSLGSLLMVEGFTFEVAEYALNSVDVDWNEQAARTAKYLLEGGLDSRAELVAMVEQFGFTTEQANYGADQAGL